MADQSVASRVSSPDESLTQRVLAEAAQAWAIAVKDIRVYYLTPPMVMFGLIMPFFIFFSFSVGRGLDPEDSVARLLAMTTFFTASSAGPVILPLERRTRTFDRLLVAPLSMVTILLGKTLVGAFFGSAVALVPLLAGLVLFQLTIADPFLLVAGVCGGALAFSAVGLLFATIPAQSVGAIMMPSTLLRWPLLFISGIFVPLAEMDPWARAVSFISPLTYTQDLLNHAVLGAGSQSLMLDILALPICLVLFFTVALKLLDMGKQRGD